MPSETRANFRYRLTFSLLSGKPTAVESDEPLDRFELLFTDLLLRLTRGSRAVLSRGDRRLDFSPGTLDCREESLTFDCGGQRSLTYFIEPLLVLLPFTKAPLSLELRGITHDSLDVDLDRLRDGLFPLLARCAQNAFALELNISRRGFRPNGGGAATLTARPLVHCLPPIALPAVPARRVRGLAIASRVSPQCLGRLIAAAREVLGELAADVWVQSESVRGADRFYGISLVTDTGVTAGACFDALSESPPPPEQLGETAALALLDELLFGGGALDSSFQSVVFSLMALARGRSSAFTTRVTDHCAATLRLLREFFAVEFVFEAAEGEGGSAVTARVRGAALANRAREAA